MRRPLALLAVAVVMGVAVYAVVSSRHQPRARVAAPQGCTVRVDGRIVYLTTSQAANAAIIAAVAQRRGLPARAASIALTAAYQESDLENLSYGDRDSLGLFQQRPSQGWGTRAQILNPVHAANAFYDALARVPDYQTSDIADAAQQVQRSAYPSAYAAHAADGRAVASALTGYSPAALSCLVNRQHLQRQPVLDDGFTPRAERVRHALTAAFGSLPISASPPGTAGSGPAGPADSPQGRTVDVLLRPVTAANRVRGWALAQYLVANAARLHIAHVSYAGRMWTAGLASRNGWQPYALTGPTGHRSRASLTSLETRDQISVEVW